MTDTPYKALALPNLDLPQDLLSCARHFSRSAGVPEGTALIILITCLLSLRSRGVTHEWLQGYKRAPHIGILCLGAQLYPKRTWLDQVVSVLRKSVTKPAYRSTYTFEELENIYSGHLRFLTSDGLAQKVQSSPEFGKQVEQRQAEGRNLHDGINACRFSEFPPSTKLGNYGFTFSSLIVSEDLAFAIKLNVEYLTSAWEEVFCAWSCPFGITTPATVVLRASEKIVRRMRERRRSADFPWPLMLPTTGPVLPLETTDSQAVEQWTTLVKAASDSWDQPERHLKIDSYGYGMLSKVREMLDDIAEYRAHSERYAWALPLCANIAVWEHLTRRAGDVISAESWNLAARLVRWAIAAHGVASRSFGRASYHPPVELADRDRIRALYMKNPKITYRELVRALPKRPKDYWRKFFNLMKPPPSSEKETPLVQRL